MPQIIEKDLSYLLTGIFFQIHKELGRFCRERQYGDVLAKKLDENNIKFHREAPLRLAGRVSNLVDFLIDGKIAIELKAKPFLDKDDYYQMQRYLHSAKLELGLLVNFQQPVLKPKRVLNPDIPHSEHSDKPACRQAGL